MSVSWTREQQKVIDLRNRSILVSAAAGSGKTAVLVERIISMVLDTGKPMDIDRLLVVTFTKAAASEMRERIAGAIEKALKKDPANAHLQRQQTLIYNAQITTIDSFCLNVIRNHFQDISLEPGFRVGDTGELDLLREDVCDEVLNRFHEEKDADFLEFMADYSAAKSDDNVRKMILELYAYSQSYPWPDQWLNACEDAYCMQGAADLNQKDWVRNFLEFLHGFAASFLTMEEEMIEITRQPDGPQAYEAALCSDVRFLKRLMECDTLEEWKEELDGLNFAKFDRVKKGSCDPDKQKYIQSGRNSMKKQLKGWKDHYFGLSAEKQADILKRTGKMVHVLIEMTQAFAEAFHQAKMKKNIIDFNDMEHLALQILVDPDTHEPTEAAREYQQQFEEIMIDEYQDSNYVQETILTAVSRQSQGIKNLFMVGDVKQSIYRFRLARPELFVGKYRRFSEEESDEQRIDLHQNFRSRPEVIDITNEVFYRLMHHDMGRVDYDESAALFCGRDCSGDPEGDYSPELILVEEEKEDTSEDKKRAEAECIAQRIRTMVKKQEIPGLTYRDIVILMRSPSDRVNIYQEVFSEADIPLLIDSRTGYFSAVEVQQTLAMLQVIDNPMQDIPMAAVMKSHYGGFSADEMAEIATGKKNEPFWQKVLEYPHADVRNDALCEKTGHFLDMLQTFRERVPYTPIHLLLEQIYTETGFYYYVSALPSGKQRKANLDMLLEKAIAYEKTSYYGLMQFNRYIDRLHKYDIDFGEAGILSEQEDTVRIMSVHHSKGLEFPVVFVAGMGKNFNQQDSRKSLIFHPEYGIGMKYMNEQTHRRIDTLIRQALSVETKTENLGEEMRILYVAMTRAEKKLILVGNFKENRLPDWLPENTGKTLPFYLRYTAGCFWDWVLLALQGKYPAVIKNREEGEENQRDYLKELQDEKNRLLGQLYENNETVQKEEEILERNMNWQYPYANQAPPHQKVSVSELKQQSMEENMSAISDIEEPVLLEEESQEEIYRPKFMEEEESTRGAITGSAMHRFMQCVDFTAYDPKMEDAALRTYLKNQIQMLQSSGKMDEDAVRRLNRRRLEHFMGSETASRMHAAACAGDLYREQPFVMSLDAGRIWPGHSFTEDVLTQGIIDAFWKEEDGVVLLDYKTDHVQTAQELIDRYRVQMRLYEEALDRCYPEKPVKEILIYSFYLGRALKIPVSEDRSYQKKEGEQM